MFFCFCNPFNDFMLYLKTWPDPTLCQPWRNTFLNSIMHESRYSIDWWAIEDPVKDKQRYCQCDLITVIDHTSEQLWCVCVCVCVYASRCFFQRLLYAAFSSDTPCSLFVSFRVFSSMFAPSLCLLVCAGRAGMSMGRGISRLSHHSPVWVRLCVCVLRGIVVLKGLMWRLMQRGQYSLCVHSPYVLGLLYSLAEVYSNPMVRKEGGGGLPEWVSKKFRNGVQYVKPLFSEATDLFNFNWFCSYTAGVSLPCS